MLGPEIGLIKAASVICHRRPYLYTEIGPSEVLFKYLCTFSNETLQVFSLLFNALTLWTHFLIGYSCDILMSNLCIAYWVWYVMHIINNLLCLMTYKDVKLM